MLAVLVVVWVMIALSAIGIDIGPLLAGAGVVGIAIGFGAQTLVRDVVSGVFFLLDDAFGWASTSRRAASRERSRASRCARCACAITGAPCIRSPTASSHRYQSQP